MALNHPGLRLAIAGLVVLFLGMLSLLVLPMAVAILPVLAGGCGVMGGFVWTILEYYGPGASSGGE